jgi:long-chain acyl-CoA synthetase
MADGTLDIIGPDAVVSLAGLFRERARRTGEAPAYLYFDDAARVWRHSSWSEMARMAARWQAALAGEGLQDGDRIAIMIRNGREWVCCEQAALGLGLVVVPLYANDRAENAAYILRDSGARWLLIEGEEHWRAMSEVAEGLGGVRRIVSLEPVAAAESRLISLAEWLPPGDGGEFRVVARDTHQLATIVYTSGTTGYPKGVMLSHRNILWNVRACLECVAVYRSDLFLSFLPLSHTFERTVGHYLPMMAGAAVAHTRSVALLAEDLLAVRPTIMISVPRIFERICGRIRDQLAERPLSRALFGWAVAVGWQRFQRRQGRAAWSASELSWPLLEALVARKVLAKLGGRLRVTICGGAALSPDVAKVFIALGLPLLQGYGLTETSPVISANRLEKNDPASVGLPLPEITVRIGHDHELLVKSPSVCLGYWRQPEATAALIDADGWLHTGDKARIEDRYLYITGRLKEIIVMANGEKVPTPDMEAAIARDPLVDQVLVIGEGRPYLSVLLVLNDPRWRSAARGIGVDPEALHDPKAEQWVLQRIAHQCSGFPGYARIRRAALSLTPWTVENGLSTPTLKLRRGRIIAHFHDEIERLYQGH